MDENSPTFRSFNETISLPKAALISGLGLFIMVLTVPFAEFYILPKLIDKDPTITFQNISEHKLLFSTAIMLNLVTILCDIVVAWSLYIFLKPVNKSLSLLTAWFRIIFAGVYLIAVTNLVNILNILKLGEQFPNNLQQYHNLITLFINSFRSGWTFALLIFAVYLFLLGYLVFKASYIPKIMGILLFISAAGYLTDSLSLFFFPHVDTSFLFITYFGELIFMGWLLVKGSRIK